MTFSKPFTLVGALALLTGLNGAPQRPQAQPTISFGTAVISLGMTVEQVEQHLAQAALHTKPLSEDKNNVLVYLNGGNSEGQIAFGNGHVVYADYQMPVVNSADELAQEIAGAVDSMETKTCAVSNYTAHGTGGGFSQSIFECGSKRFNVMTVQEFGSSPRAVNVNIEIGRIVAK
jgi:hypothetical protein